MYTRIVTAAVANNRELVIAFESTAVLVRGLTSHPSWPGKEPQDGVHVRLIANVETKGLRPGTTSTRCAVIHPTRDSTSCRFTRAASPMRSSGST